MVFVSPSDRFALPPGWAAVLSREGLVLVSARASGNDQDTLERRVPLALNGYGYAIRHLPIDPALRNPSLGALAPIRVVN